MLLLLLLLLLLLRIVFVIIVMLGDGVRLSGSQGCQPIVPLSIF